MRLNFKTCEELTQLNIKQQTIPVKKWAEDMNRLFLKKSQRWPTGT